MELGLIGGRGNGEHNGVGFVKKYAILVTRDTSIIGSELFATVYGLIPQRILITMASAM